MRLVHDRKLQLTVIFVAALLVRLGAMFFLETYLFRTEHAFGYGYGATAKHVALGEGFSLGYYDSGTPRATAVSPPAYVYFIALIFSLFGIYSVQSAIVIEIIQSLFAAFTCIVFYKIGSRFDEKVGLLAALGMAFYPPSILHSTMRISPIILVVLMLAIIMYYLFKILDNLHYRDAVVCGLLMGLTALLTPSVILFYVMSCVWLWFWSSKARLTALKCSIIMGLVCIVCVVPWTIRNYNVFGTFVFIKSSMGNNLLIGNNPYGDNITFFGSGFDELLSEEEIKSMKDMDEVRKDKLMLKKAMSFIKNDPKWFLGLTLKRIYYFWSFANPYRPTPYDGLRKITYGPIFILAVIGVLLTRNKWRETSLLLLFLLSYPLVYYVTQVTLYRYRYPVEPFLVLLASYVLVALFERFRGRRARVPMADRQGKPFSARSTSANL